jgi:hypothetical protein
VQVNLAMDLVLVVQAVLAQKVQFLVLQLLTQAAAAAVAIQAVQVEQVAVAQVQLLQQIRLLLVVQI